MLKKFIETVNGKDGTGSHLVTIPPGPHLSDALISSPIVQVKTYWHNFCWMTISRESVDAWVDE